ncbi:MAG: hypothetical protein V3R83_09810 [Gammaproteobacteria bacterium]
MNAKSDVHPEPAFFFIIPDTKQNSMSQPFGTAESKFRPVAGGYNP